MIIKRIKNYNILASNTGSNSSNLLVPNNNKTITIRTKWILTFKNGTIKGNIFAIDDSKIANSLIIIGKKL